MSPFEVFLHRDQHAHCVAVLMRGASIVEQEDGQLTPLLGLTADTARMLAGALVACADTLDHEAAD